MMPTPLRIMSSVFDELESPLCVSCLPNGLLNGTDYHYLARNTHTVPLTDDLFDYDSHCMLNLRKEDPCHCGKGYRPRRALQH